MIEESEKHFSPLSLERVQPPFKMLEDESSLDAGWTSLLVQKFENPVSQVDVFEVAPTPDLNLVLFTGGISETESYSGNSWKKGIQRAGDGAITAGGKTDRLRSRRLTSETVQMIGIHIPAYYFEVAADEYRRAGTTSKLEQPDALAFHDPVVAQIVYSLLEAIRSGMPNLYAESVAQFLAAHLLAKNSRWRDSVSAVRNPGVLPDYRLKRALEYMRHHLAENLSLDNLAREAGISRFHFITLFKQAVSATPHQYLLGLRLQHAAELLAETDLSVQMIAANCGFVAPSHFSKSFYRYFGQTPSDYRRANLTSILHKKFR